MTEVPGAGALFQTRNPADLSDIVAEVSLASSAEFVQACRRARGAQLGWAEVPAPVRGRVIAQVGRLVESNKEALAALVTREVGKPYAESLGEVQEVIDTCDFFLGEGRRLYGQTVPSEMADKQLFTFRVPVGVAAIITASNFPTAVPSWYLVPALLCGNAVVWKAAETSGGIAQALLELFHNGGVPEDVLQLVLADGPTTFAGLERALDEGLVDKVGLHRVDRRRPLHRRARRTAPAERLPRARREEPARRHAGRRPRPGGPGGPVLRVRHLRAALHEPRHRVGAPRRLRRLPRRLRLRGRGRGRRRPVREGPLRADALRALPRQPRAQPRPHR